MLDYQEIVAITKNALKEKIPVGTEYSDRASREIYRKDVETLIKATASEGDNFVYVPYLLEDNYIEELQAQGFSITNPNGFTRIEWSFA